mmetsp:Transcript_26444/g.81364  ORF Transcript_26444/g.81364 Transcript_26444/m.81364 type:complete len:315 (+) Transcript_26444:239-1183(+)
MESRNRFAALQEAVESPEQDWGVDPKAPSKVPTDEAPALGVRHGRWGPRNCSTPDGGAGHALPDAEGVAKASAGQPVANPDRVGSCLLARSMNLGRFAAHPDCRRPRYDYFCVVDFECTCDEVNTKPHEIIEFPAVFVNAHTLDVDFEFHSFVQPSECPRLTAFCTHLTGIEQCQVDAARSLHVTLLEFEEFCIAHGLVAGRRAEGGMRTFCIATDGPWDVRKFLAPECERKRITGFAKTWQRVVNIRRLFRDHFKLERGGVQEMLGRVGLEFEGREHSGIDDSRNIARLLAVLLADGVDVCHNLEVRFGFFRS